MDQKYFPEQMCNVDELSLWKCMPEYAYAHQESKVILGSRDHVTLPLGGNVAGFKLKHFLIYHLENPRAFKNVRSTHFLFTYYHHNKEVWVSSALFEDWFLNSYSTSQRCCRQSSIPFKILLILDDAPRHPQHVTAVLLM